MKHIATILVLFSIFLLGCGTNKEILTSLNSKFQNGDVIIVNGWALMNSNEFFNPHKNRMKVENIQKIDKDTAVAKFGIWGENHDVYNVSAKNLKSNELETLIDSRVLNVLIPNDTVFYFINGGPFKNYLNVIMQINQRTVTEITKVPPVSAKAIWGTNMGKSGALIINTEKLTKKYLIEN